MEQKLKDNKSESQDQSLIKREADEIDNKNLRKEMKRIQLLNQNLTSMNEQKDKTIM